MSYPRDLKMFVSKMSGYSRNTLKITPYRTNAVKSSDIITVDLPNSSMLDLDTLCFHFKGSTTATNAGGVRFPKNIESIISKILVEINGQTLNSCQNLSDLYNILYNLQQGSDLKQKRQLYQNSVPAVASPTTVETETPYKIQNFVGFLGSVKPEVLDTALLGAVRLHINLESKNVLVGGAGATGPDYQLDGLYFTVDCVSIDDGVYYAAKNSYLANGGVFEMPFDNWYSSLFSTGGTFQQSSRFSVATGSLDLLLAAFPKDRAFGSNVTAIDNGAYFQYDANGLADYQFSINNVAIPQYRPLKHDAYALTLNALNLTQDTLGGIDSKITDATTWTNNFWVAAARLDHPCDPDERFVSGLSTLGTNAQIEFNSTQGTGSNVCPYTLLFAKTSAILRVGAGKSLEIVS
jgi:hypothetical protein